LLFGSIRIFIRLTINPGWGLDDALFGVSTIVAIIQSSIVLAACHDGLGKSIEFVSLENQSKVQQMYYASTLFFVIALGLCKISVAFFLLRLTQTKHHRLVFNAAAGFIAVWTVGSLFAVALQCNLSHPWLIVGERCSGAFLRWRVISAFDILSEIILVAMPVYLIWGLATTISTKAAVVAAFSFRLLTIIPIAFRLSNFNKAGRISNPTLREDLFIVWTQTELNYSLISATIPTLRLFVKNLNTQLGGVGPAGSGNEQGYGYGSNPDSHLRSNGNYQMLNLKSANRRTIRDEHTTDQLAGGQSNAHGYGMNHTGTGVNNNQGGQIIEPKSREENNSGDAASVGSNDSRRMIIRKDVSYKVEYVAH